MCQIERREILQKLGERIRELRHKKKISQEELAFKIGSARNFVGCIERAEKAPTIITLAKIANEFNLSLSELLKNI